MSETAALTSRKAYGMFAFWGLHTLTLALFLILEANGFHLLVSNLFYFAWTAIWIMHGLTVLLLPKYEWYMMDVDAETSGFWRRMTLGAHSALYVAFGPAVFLWWLMVRTPGPQQPGEGQGFWIYPLWLMVLLAHGAYVMMRERQAVPVKVGQKRKRDVPGLKRLMEADSDEIDAWDDEQDENAAASRGY